MIVGWKCNNCGTRREIVLFSLRKSGLCGTCQRAARKKKSLPQLELNLKATHITYCNNCEMVDEYLPVVMNDDPLCMICMKPLEVRVFV